MIACSVFTPHRKLTSKQEEYYEQECKDHRLCPLYRMTREVLELEELGVIPRDLNESQLPDLNNTNKDKKGVYVVSCPKPVSQPLGMIRSGAVVGRNSNFGIRCSTQHVREAIGADASALTTFRKKFPAKLTKGSTYEICEFSELKWKVVFTGTQISNQLLPRLKWPSGQTYGGTEEEVAFEKTKDAIYLMELVMELLMNRENCVSESQGFESRMRGKKTRKKRKVM